MKNLMLVLFFLFSGSLFSQVVTKESPVSTFHLSILGGTNFTTISSIGGSLQIEGKTNLSENLFLKAYVGYSGIAEEKDYMIKSYSPVHIGNYDGYQLKTYSVNQIEYSVIPVNLGIEYFLSNSKITPFGVVELGYNFYSSEEQIKSSASSELFENKNEIPTEYKNNAPRTIDDSSFGVSAGVGLLYRISSSFNVNIRYLYRYNDSLIDVNQILLGITI